ncbi:hypothetical protein K431DRAFT_160402 [Polychaeton citri CBS 116435]|uniref:Uncharacterized protein n=1 Tax=Polychaeton citri CBS 116435 TaxID=1314669 RepID=A0A9P4Q350_9PEZI|nr:hypothetical protein K431DRAFT_160402 [Polychaeton citri CBS 116435]
MRSIRVDMLAMCGLLGPGKAYRRLSTGRSKARPLDYPGTPADRAADLRPGATPESQVPSPKAQGSRPKYGDTTFHARRRLRSVCMSVCLHEQSKSASRKGRLGRTWAQNRQSQSGHARISARHGETSANQRSHVFQLHLSKHCERLGACFDLRQINNLVFSACPVWVVR